LLTAQDIHQDEDVVDTWFSSWLWPISVFDGFKDPNNKDIQYYYPTSVLVTGWDIIFFWVARMIFAGYEFKNEKPFSKVYFTGMVRDKQRRKMSKSLGNSPDTLELLAKFGADGVRFGVMSAAAAGNDLLYDDKQPEQGRNFCNKMWNALRLIKGWEVTDGSNGQNEIAIQWFETKLNATIAELGNSFEDFRLSEALMNLYKLLWMIFARGIWN
jgi:valyl-tRNA synthetase